MIGWGIALAVVLLVGFTRVGVFFRRNEAGISLKIKIGLLWLRVLPTKLKKRKARPEKPAPPAQKPAAKKEKRAFPVELTAGAVGDLADRGAKLIRRFFRGIRVDLLALDVTVGGDDCAGAAVQYGRLNAVVYALYPVVKSCVRVRKSSVRVGLDYGLAASRYCGALRITVSIGRLLVIGAAALASLTGFYFRHRTKETNKKEAIPHGQQA